MIIVNSCAQAPQYTANITAAPFTVQKVFWSRLPQLRVPSYSTSPHRHRVNSWREPTPMPLTASLLRVKHYCRVSLGEKRPLARARLFRLACRGMSRQQRGERAWRTGVFRRRLLFGWKRDFGMDCFIPGLGERGRDHEGFMERGSTGDTCAAVQVQYVLYRGYVSMIVYVHATMYNSPPRYATRYNL